MDDRNTFATYLAVWAALLLIFIWRSWYSKYKGVGLVLAYCFQLWLFYWLPSLLHYLPWTKLPESDLVLLGFQQSTYALTAFLMGTLVTGPLFAKAHAHRPALTYVPDARLPGTYITIGVVSFTILSPIFSRLPSLGALAGTGQQLIIVGFCLLCWQAWREGSIAKAVGSLGPLLFLPLVTVVNAGFLGYGFMTISVVFIFCAQFFRPKYLLILGCLVIGYFGLSLYVTYMRDRNEIRQSVWGGATFSSRLDRFAKTLSTFELFDAHNEDHLTAIDKRLNQASLVGAAVVHLRDTSDFAHGQTIQEAALAMIPRLLWPDKNVFAGSGDWASRFTGITFAEGTSVGIGQVLEFYGNFGERGVVTGFFLYGLLLGALDMIAAFRLFRNDWQGFAFTFVIGTSLLAAGGSLVEVSASAMAAIVLMYGASTALEGYQKIIRRFHTAHAPMAGHSQ